MDNIIKYNTFKLNEVNGAEINIVKTIACLETDETCKYRKGDKLMVTIGFIGSIEQIQLFDRI